MLPSGWISFALPPACSSGSMLGVLFLLWVGVRRAPVGNKSGGLSGRYRLIERLSENTLRRLYFVFSRIPGWLSYLWNRLHPMDLHQMERWADYDLSTARKMRQVEKAWTFKVRQEVRSLVESFRPRTNNSGGRLTEQEIDVAKHYNFPSLVNSEEGEKILCQWHPDTNESMQVYGNGAHCFVCGKNVDSIAWVMETEGLSFAEAVRKLNRL